MVTVYIKKPGSSLKQPLVLPDGAEFEEVRKQVSELTGFPASKLSLVLRGKALKGSSPPDKAALDLAENDTLLAVVKPSAPPEHVSRHSRRHAEEEDDDDEADLRVELPPSDNSLQNAIARFLRDRLHCPDYLLVVFFWFSLRTWLLILLWFCMAPVVHHYLELGPIYVLGTCFALIFFNLGTRREGEASAYSIFNEGFRELPGTLNADRLDQDIRAGRL